MEIKGFLQSHWGLIVMQRSPSDKDKGETGYHQQIEENKRRMPSSIKQQQLNHKIYRRIRKIQSESIIKIIKETQKDQ